VSEALQLDVNGERHMVFVDADTPLLTVLRNDLALNGPKYGCGLGECGACMVLVDGAAARSCVLPASAVTGRRITTLEGLAPPGQMHAVQRGFVEGQGAQCGYCLNGMIMRIAALLDAVPDPSDIEIREALRHNLCRCGAHLEILDSVRAAIRIAKDDRA